MRELRGVTGFTPERAYRFVITRDHRMQCFERNLALERKISRPPHRSKRATAEFGEKLVIVANGPSHARFGRRHCIAIRPAGHHCNCPRRVAAVDLVEPDLQRWKTGR